MSLFKMTEVLKISNLLDTSEDYCFRHLFLLKDLVKRQDKNMTAGLK